MKLATTILAHHDLPLVKDTIESVKLWMTNDILLVVDKAGWHHFENQDLPCPTIQGFYHNHYRSPYRNFILSLSKLQELYSSADWYICLEYDSLIVSSSFKKDLAELHKKKVWVTGCDIRTYNFSFPLLEKIVDHGNIKESKYVFGCCHFYHSDFILKLKQINFFDRFLEMTDGMKPEFPGYPRHSFTEELLPTVANHFGGKIYELSCWKEREKSWRGSLLYFMRFKPEISIEEVPPSASILHPIKSIHHPIRQYYKNQRNKINNA